jgi:alpha-beta hydrolase superfamily lysophospholipase
MHAHPYIAPVLDGDPPHDTHASALRTDGMCGAIAYTCFTPQSAEPYASLPLVLVHGAAHTRLIFESWAMFLAARGITVITLDLRGHGQSSMPTGQSVRHVRSAGYLADLRTLITGLDELRAGQFVLLGHSMGGILVQLYARAFPVAGLIVLAAVAPHHALRAMLGLTCRFPRPMLHALHTGLQTAFGSPQGVRTFLLEADAPDERVRIVLDQLTPESTAIVRDIRQFRRQGHRPMQTDHVLFLGGERDTCFLPSHVSQSAQAYGTRAICIPTAPHDLMVAAPPARDAAAETIAGFVRACAEAQPRVAF